MAYTVRNVRPWNAGTKSLVVQPVPSMLEEPAGRLNSAEPTGGSVFHQEPGCWRSQRGRLNRPSPPGGPYSLPPPAPSYPRGSQLRLWPLQERCHRRRGQVRIESTHSPRLPPAPLDLAPPVHLAPP